MRIEIGCRYSCTTVPGLIVLATGNETRNECGSRIFRGTVVTDCLYKKGYVADNWSVENFICNDDTRKYPSDVITPGYHYRLKINDSVIMRAVNSEYLGDDGAVRFYGICVKTQSSAFKVDAHYPNLYAGDWFFVENTDENCYQKVIQEAKQARHYLDKLIETLEAGKK